MSITDIYLIYNDDNQMNRIGEANLKVSPIFHFIDYRDRKVRKDAWKIMNHWGTMSTPFAIVYNNEAPIKAFYTEADDDIINSLIQYLNE